MGGGYYRLGGGYYKGKRDWNGRTVINIYQTEYGYYNIVLLIGKIHIEWIAFVFI